MRLAQKPPCSRKQDRLRKACEKGNLEVVQSLLKQQTSYLNSLLEAVLGKRLATSCGVSDEWQQPADIHHAFVEDDGNTPLHYIASGRKRHVSMPRHAAPCCARCARPSDQAYVQSALKKLP